MKVSIDTLGLDHLWLIYPGKHIYPADKKITVWPLADIAGLA